MQKIICYFILALTLLNAKTFNTPMKEYIDTLRAEAKMQNPSFTDFDIKRGEKIFNDVRIGKKGKEISCTTCHSTNLKASGQNINTNKFIEPLAPSVNPSRLSDVAEVEKWLRRNFNDVFSREGSSLEKGDVLTYIINQ